MRLRRATGTVNESNGIAKRFIFRDHIQVFIDRFRYNANRAAQVQSKIKILEKLPVLYPPEPPEVVKFGFNAPAEERINGTLLQMDNVEFAYSSSRQIFKVTEV